MANFNPLTYRGKKILITGGTGSVGRALLSQILPTQPKQVRVLCNDEYALYELEREFPNSTMVRCLVGDVRDRERVRKAVHGVDIVFHAAALKHVPLCEQNPFEAVLTNVIGTQNLVEAAMYAEVDRVVVISTDKAAAPLNVMGATKLLAEKLATNTLYYRGDRKTLCCAVRFGNVLASRGSVLETFQHQLDKNLPITITAERMTRFMMTLPEASSLVLRAAEMTQGSEVFILKMPAVSIHDLAQGFIANYAKKNGKDKNSVPVKMVPGRVGEKIHELLMTREESKSALEGEDMFILRPYLQFSELIDDKERQYPGTKPATYAEYSSEGVRLCTSEEISRMLLSSGF